MTSLKLLEDAKIRRNRILLAIIVFFIYFLIGVSYFMGKMELTFLEALYFSVVILMTIG